jgi:hypothetical protein
LIAAIESDSSDEVSSPQAAFDAAFDSLWDDVETDSLIPQLV